MKNIGEKIRELREKRNFTQEFMAQELDLTPNGYGKIERGDSKVTFDKLEKIANILKIKLADLIDLNGTAPNLDFYENKIENNHNVANIIICEISENERKLYEQQINFLKEENAYLRSLIDKFTAK